MPPDRRSSDRLCVRRHCRDLHPLLPWNQPPNECCGNWTPDGEYFVFRSIRNDVRNVWAIREKGRLLRGVSCEPVLLTSGTMASPNPFRAGTARSFCYRRAAPRRVGALRLKVAAVRVLPFRDFSGAVSGEMPVRCVRGMSGRDPLAEQVVKRRYSNCGRPTLRTSSAQRAMNWLKRQQARTTRERFRPYRS